MEISNEVDKRTLQTATDNVLYEIKALLVDIFKKVLWKFKLKSSDGYFDVYELQQKKFYSFHYFQLIQSKNLTKKQNPLGELKDKGSDLYGRQSTLRKQHGSSCVDKVEKLLQE